MRNVSKHIGAGLFSLALFIVLAFPNLIFGQGLEFFKHGNVPDQGIPPGAVLGDFEAGTEFQQVEDFSSSEETSAGAGEASEISPEAGATEESSVTQTVEEAVPVETEITTEPASAEQQAELPEPEITPVRYTLPSPRSFFQLLLPIPDPIIEIIDQFNDILVDPICPAPEITAPICSLSIVDVSSPNNDYQLIWRCGGTFRPCTLHANDEVVGHLRGAGVANLNLGSERTTIYELKDRNERVCGGGIVHTFRVNTTPAPGAPSAAISQVGYRWFDPANSVTPGSPKVAENTSADLDQLTEFRLRLLLHTADADMSVGTGFKMQWGIRISTCGALAEGDWGDLSASSGDIRYFNNSTPADGDAITATGNDPTHSSDTVVPQTYQEVNNFGITTAVSAGQDAMWDFSMEDFGAIMYTPHHDYFVKLLDKSGLLNIASAGGAGGTSLCFRAVNEDGSVLNNGYDIYPRAE